MKLNKYTSLAPILCISLLTLSCSPKGVQSTENNIKFDSISVHLNPHFFNDPAKPTYELNLEFVYPDAGPDAERLAAIRRIFIETALDRDFGDLTPKEAVKAWTDDFMEYVKTTEDAYREALEQHGHADDADGEWFFGTDAQLYVTRGNDIIFNKNNILSYGVGEDAYEGGAHGSFNYNCFNIDLTNASLIKERDIFIEGYEEPLAEQIIAKLAGKNGLAEGKDLEDIGYFSVDEIAPNGNFSIDETGITYYYNQYEIAAYAIGLIEVVLTYEELKPLLREDSPLKIFFK
jgi:hypothetical protein